MLTAFDLLIDPQRIEPAPVCALVGDEGYLQHEATRALIARILGPGEESAATWVDGREALWRDLYDALGERSLFGGDARVVVLEYGDPFIKEYRGQLEDYVAKPAADATLVIHVQSLPGNTRLGKSIADKGLILQSSPPARDPGGAYSRKLKEWLASVAKRQFDRELQKPAIDALLDLVPPDPGILYQEISKLALVAGPKKKIDVDLVRDHVGGWRTRTTWEMNDAVADGRASEALLQIDRLLAAGEEPFGLLPQMAFTLRKFAQAAQLIEEGERRRQPVSLGDALKKVGILPFKLGAAEQQLRRIGRPRARQLYRWLLAADLEMKGHNSSKERARRVLETLVIRLAQPASPTAAAAR